MNYRLIIGILLTASITTFGTLKQTIQFSYYGNFKATLYTPNTGLPYYPVIVFLYDDFYESVGEKTAKNKGYDIDEFANIFAEWGYMTLVPMGSIQNTLKIHGALTYLQKLPRADKHDTHVIASSTQAITVLAAHTTKLRIQSLTLITPRDCDDTSFTTTTALKRCLPNISERVLILGTERESTWATKSQLHIKSLLESANIPTTYKTYLYKKPWFWNPRNPFMNDIQTFIEQRSHASTNTYQSV